MQNEPNLFELSQILANADYGARPASPFACYAHVALSGAATSARSSRNTDNGHFQAWRGDGSRSARMFDEPLPGDAREGRQPDTGDGQSQYGTAGQRSLGEDRQRRALQGSGVTRSQSSARIPKPVSLGNPSRISTKPKSVSAARSIWLTDNIFVRLPLTSRIAQRRWISVSRSSVDLPRRKKRRIFSRGAGQTFGDLPSR